MAIDLGLISTLNNPWRLARRFVSFSIQYCPLFSAYRGEYLSNSRSGVGLGTKGSIKVNRGTNIS